MRNVIGFLKDDEEKELEGLFRGNRYDSDEDDTNDDDYGHDESMEFEVRAKRKMSEPVTLKRFFREKIRRYQNKQKEADIPSFLRHSEDSDHDDECNYKDLREITGLIKHAEDDCLVIMNGEKAEFVLLPNGREKALRDGMEVYLVTETFEECCFLKYWMELAGYQAVAPALEGLAMDEKIRSLKTSQDDADGFALWSRLGSVKRDEPKAEVNKNRMIEDRAKEIMKRIPLECEDLYRNMDRALKRFRNCSYTEKNDYATALSCVSFMTVLMLDGSTNLQQISVGEIREMFPNAVIREPGSDKKDFSRCPANILIAGGQFRKAVDALEKSGHGIHLINMAGVEGNDYLFAESMTHYGAWPGRLVTEYEDAGTLSSVFVFEGVDLMENSGRAGDPKNGLANLLRTHRIRDCYLRDFEIDASRTQFICQVSDFEACPRVILNEIDIIVEL